MTTNIDMEIFSQFDDAFYQTGLIFNS